MLHFLKDNSLTKVQQIAKGIALDIERGFLKKDMQLPSINEFNKIYKVARETVEKAYKILKDEGYIVSVASKGYYVSGKSSKTLKVLLVFNKLSSYKKIVYDNLIKSLGEQATVELRIHHYSPKLFKEIVEEALGKYHYYLIMPHFLKNTPQEEYIEVLKQIPFNQLILLDKNVPELKGDFGAVFQNFKEDIYTALIKAIPLLKKYRGIKIIFPSFSNHPVEILEGISKFCQEQKKRFIILEQIEPKQLKSGYAYIVIADADLANLIKQSKEANLQIGKDVGIISFNETILKEILNITVVTTDFEHIGREAASYIMTNNFQQTRSPFSLITRGSL
ncbi:GntR family transcriptional regulator [Arachidicoccus sp.]|uniref:winged helix-turn-helix domain-containing protein n=1 Tax=Arachidicoccus sp. TaxID=1872624 RepID=UPI003D227864